MGKSTPETVEYFNVLVRRIPKEMLGDVLGDLAKRGLSEVLPELVTDVLSYKSRQQHDTSATDFLTAWVAEHPTFTLKEVTKHFRESGRTSAAAYYAIKQLNEARTIKKLDDNGNYTRADVKHIEAPKKDRAATPAKAKRVVHDVDHREFILGYARAHGGRCSATKLRDYFTKHKRNPNSVGGALNYLVEHKKLKLLGEGEYLLLAKGGAKPKPTATAKPPKLNGAAAHVQPAAAPEVAANG
ncbi:hypothetical protein QIH85_23960 [Bradyrhizobium japonicum]|uniref:hypothetical protein n=1 Tax=Bradyrhizobium japonicum TaxID=375 RepID=UPI0027145D87|nr:hypothetical protein [Bradyrhizobium japonicum]WLB24939.1 hypothetical protein QIH85_23960 [Bradyrhizobium japonicum]